jgi:hypothetical protein
MLISTASNPPISSVNMPMLFGGGRCSFDFNMLGCSQVAVGLGIELKAKDPSISAAWKYQMLAEAAWAIWD